MRFTSTLATLAFVATTLSPTLARATVTEPNGMVVPLDTMNGEVQLYTLFTQRGEAIDYRADAATTPAVFSPLCNFRATFVLHEAGEYHAVGWYNVAPGDTMPPALADIHEVVPAGAPVGTVVTSADIRASSAYAGGLIGFALIGPQIHYSEQRWNAAYTQGSMPGPWATALIYRSTVTPNAYYVAFEDGYVSDTSFNNDGDFNDDVFFFEGLSCEGGNQPCDTGMPGICSQGLTECSAAGVTCRATVQPRAETCNGLDDNCDGTADEGDGLCPTGNVCDHGTCVPMCVEGSCFTGETCTSRGTCVETACATVTCPSGQVCAGGMCRASCDGVVCPGSQVCQSGLCVDPCAGVTCASGTVCSSGVCITSCGCQPCSAGNTCQTSSGLCVPSGCESLTCATGQVCRAGACVDACDGAVCPPGQACNAGTCVDVPPVTDAGMDAGSDASLDGSSSDVASNDANADVVGDIALDANHGDAGTDGGVGTTTSNCGCRVPGRVGATGWGWMAAIAVALAWSSRKRRS